MTGDEPEVITFRSLRLSLDSNRCYALVGWRRYVSTDRSWLYRTNW